MAKQLSVSPLAPATFPELPEIPGVELAGAHIGLKRVAGAKDLMIAHLTAGTTVAGVFTRSRCPSAPVDWCRRILPHGRVRAIVVNSGNANAFTGSAGDLTVAATVAAAAERFGCAQEEIYVASTGVIGVPVPATHIADAIPGVAAQLSPLGWKAASEAIMTTDTFPKSACRTARIGDTDVRIAGITKGSGMIAPDMATTLGFIFTDAALPAPVLQALLKRAADRSYNSMTVDSDTSTSDTLLVCATGRAGNPPVATAGDRSLHAFRAALEDLAVDLATQIVRDGEGATKFVTIDVTGAVSSSSARRLGLAIANSPLVKTAIAGQDANWGRIVMAVGKAGEPADRDRLSISMGGVPITENGQLRPDYDETPVAAHLKGQDVHIGVDLGLGRGKARVWTCDLTHGYISINADYRS